MSYNHLDDVPLSIRTGNAQQPAAEAPELTPENIFSVQFSDADFDGDSDASDLGPRHTPVPGPAQKTRFYVPFCGMLWETTCAGRAVRTSARPPSDTVLSSPGRRTCHLPAYSGKSLISFPKINNTWKSGSSTTPSEEFAASSNVRSWRMILTG